MRHLQSALGCDTNKPELTTEVHSSLGLVLSYLEPLKNNTVFDKEFRGAINSLSRFHGGM